MNEEAKVSSKPVITNPWDLLKKSLIWYRDNWRNLWKMIIAMIAPIVVFGVLFNVLGFSGRLDDFSSPLARIVVALIIFLLTCLTVYFVFRAQLSLYLLLKNPSDKFMVHYRAARKLFWPGFGLALLSGVFVFLWAILLIIPGIVFWVFYSLALFVFVFEGTKGHRAIKASQKLVKGYFWAVFGRYLYFALPVIILSFVAGIPRLLMTSGSMVLVGYNYITSLASYFITPLFLIYTYFIYRDLKAIKS